MAISRNHSGRWSGLYMTRNEGHEPERDNVFTWKYGCRATVKVSGLEHLENIEKDKMCPECEKHRKHVKLVEVDGKILKCPACNYLHLVRR